MAELGHVLTERRRRRAIPKPRHRDPERFAPVFLLAPPRSCSSVVTTLIGSHPDLYGFPELILFPRETVRELLESDRSPEERGFVLVARSGLLRTLAQLHDGTQAPEAIDAARAWLEERQTWSGGHIFDHLLELVAPSIGIEKSPNTVGAMDSLGRVSALYPRARFIHLTRHPLTTMRSMQANWGPYAESEEEWKRVPFESAAGWYLLHRRIVDFLNGLPEGRSLRLRAEDVLGDPPALAQRIAAWLGVRTDEEAIEAMLGPERSPYASRGPENAPGGNDPKFLHNPVLRPIECPTSLDLPLEWGVGPRLQLSITMLATELGYPHEPAATAAN